MILTEQNVDIISKELKRFFSDDNKFIQAIDEKYNGIKDIILDNYTIMEKAIKKNGRNIKHASENLRNNKNLIIKSLYLRNLVMKYIPNSFIENNSELFKALDYINNYEPITYINDINLAIDLVRVNRNNFFLLNEELKNNEEIILAVIKAHPSNYMRIIEYIRNEEIILKMIEEKPSVLKYIEYERKVDKNFLVRCVERNSKSMDYISKNLKYDKDFFLNLIINYDKFDYSTVSNFKELLKDESVVRNIIHQGDNLKIKKILSNCDNKSLIMEALRKNVKYIIYIPDKYKEDKDIFNFFLDLSLICKNKKHKNYIQPLYFYLKNFPESFKEDSMIIKKLLNLSYEFFIYANDLIKSDRELVKKVLQQNPSMLSKLSKYQQNDYELVEIAVKNYPISIIYASDSLKNNEKLAEIYLNIDGIMLKYSGEKVKNNKKLIFMAIKNNPSSAKFAPLSFRKDRNFIMKCFKYQTNDSDMSFIPFEFRYDQEIINKAIELNGCNISLFNNITKENVMKALDNNPNSFFFLPESYQKDKDVIEKTNYKI